MRPPSRQSVRFKVDPRMVSAQKAARRLGIALSSFEAKLPELLAVGFPEAEPITGNYVLDSIDRWIDGIGHLDEAAERRRVEAEIMERIRSAPWRRT